MARQPLEREKIAIPEGGRVSSPIALHGDAVVLTIYAPKLTGGEAFVEVSPDGERYLLLVHKGVPVKVKSDSACNLPIPACKLLRVASMFDQDEVKTFQVLELLEIG